MYMHALSLTLAPNFSYENRMRHIQFANCHLYMNPTNTPSLHERAAARSFNAIHTDNFNLLLNRAKRNPHPMHCGQVRCLLHETGRVKARFWHVHLARTCVGRRVGLDAAEN